MLLRDRSRPASSKYWFGVSGSQQNGCAFGDDDRMLVVRGRPAIGGPHGPAIGSEDGPPRTSSDNGLHGNDQSFGEYLMRLRVRVVGNARFFVDGAADPVPTQFPDHRKTFAANLTLDRTADFRNAKAGARNQHRFFKSAARASYQTLRLGCHRTDAHGLGSIRHKAIFFD